MSRCFPFPPPGYEKKARTDDTDILIKEKQKEKKHKKDKKDKEKREGKEKSDKERSKDRDKEKKDRKEKHKEKKDKDHDKEKIQALAEKKVEKQPESYIGEKIVPNSRNVEIKDSKYVQELARRIEDDEEATRRQMVQVQNAVAGQRSAIFLEKVVESNNGNLFKENKKINGFRNLNDASVLENEIVRNSCSVDLEKVDRKAKPLDQTNVEKKMESKEQNKHNGGRSTGQNHKDKDREKKSKSKDKDRKKEKKKEEIVKKSEQTKDQSKLKEGNKGMSGTSIIKTSHHILKNTKISVEGDLGVHNEVEMKRESTNEQPKLTESHKQSPSTCIVKSANFMEGSKFSAGVGILGKPKEHEMKEEPRSKESRKDMTVICIVKSSNHVKDSTESFAGEGNFGKRKEFEINGIRCDNGMRPNKSLRPVSSFHPAVENARKTEPCQTANQVEPERQGATSNHKEHSNRGLVDAQPSNVVPREPASATIQVNENGEVCGRSPHPDSKYLKQILSVPKIEVCSDLDDQEWLFGSNDLRVKKPKLGSPGDRTSQVWAEALQIQCADLYALPYVLPY